MATNKNGHKSHGVLPNIGDGDILARPDTEKWRNWRYKRIWCVWCQVCSEILTGTVLHSYLVLFLLYLMIINGSDNIDWVGRLCE